MCRIQSTLLLVCLLSIGAAAAAKCEYRETRLSAFQLETAQQREKGPGDKDRDPDRGRDKVCGPDRPKDSDKPVDKDARDSCRPDPDRRPERTGPSDKGRRNN